MTIGVNEVTLIGYVGQTPEVRYSTKGYAMASFPLATHKTWKDRKGQSCHDTQWHRMLCLGTYAELARTFLHKGSKCYIKGELQNSLLEDGQGNKRWQTKVLVKKIQCLDSLPAESPSDDAALSSIGPENSSLDNWLEE